MDTVTVDKNNLISRIKANRERHRAIYEKAIEIYRAQAVLELNSLVDALKNGKTPQLHVRLPIPDDHTRDYDAVLDMLNSSVNSTIEISQSDFRRYARDEWDWKKQFLGTVSNYVVDYMEQES